LRVQLNILAFVSGVGLLQQQAELPRIGWAWGLLVVVIVTGLLGRYQSPVVIAIRRIFLWFLFLGIGFFWAAALAHLRLADSLPQDW